MDGVALLRAGRAFVDLSAARRVIEVGGSDAREWLNDLVSADIGDLAPGRAMRSLLLTPTGRIRAEFTVAKTTDGYLLVQDAAQPRSVADLLEPYTLSSDVVLTDRTSLLRIAAVPNAPAPPPPVDGVLTSSPSSLDAEAGFDLVGPAEGVEEATRHLRLEEVTAEDAEAFRIVEGTPRFGVDALEDDLPQEGGFGDSVAYDKGCYLGQEAMAKVRNLGHPRRLVVPFETDAAVAAGESVVTDAGSAGVVTSAVRHEGRTYGLARIAWAHRDARPLRTERGAELTPRRAA